jgi:UMF1 family MFS transporter
MEQTTFTPKASRRERWAWYLYDFGNSAYAAVVLLAVYSAYFKGTVVGGAEGTRLWGIAVGIAMLFVALTAPVLGTIADFTGAKKRVLLFYTILSCLFTASLFFVQEGNAFIGVLFFVLAEIGYRSAQVFYNSLLPDIAHLDEMGHISGNGWAIGSFGGIICLLIVLALIQTIGGAFIVRISFVITAVFFFASTIPLFLFLRERQEPQTLPEGENYFTLAFSRLKETFKAVRSYKEFIKFIVAFLIYNDGIMMMLNFAAIIGAVLFGLEQQQLIIFMIIVQITSVIGAYVFGRFGEKFGAKPTLIISLILMIGACVWLFFVQTVFVFNLIGALAGFSLTGAQSVSRTVVGVLSPPEKSAEFYGFYSMAGRSSSFIGPAIYGWLAAFLTFRREAAGVDIVAAEEFGTRGAIGAIIFFLLVGIVLLTFVNDPEKEVRKERRLERKANN